MAPQLAEGHSAGARSIRWARILLTDYLREWARRTPDKASLIYYGREVTFAELDRLSDAFAAWLHAHGVRKGDRVAVFLPNCPQFHIAFFGILKLGAIHVPVNPLFKAHELIYELNDTGAKVVLSLDALFPLVAEVKDKTSVETILVTSMGAMLPESRRSPCRPGLDAPPDACPGAIDFLPRARCGEERAACGRRSASTTSPRSTTPAARPACRRAACTRSAT